VVSRAGLEGADVSQARLEADGLVVATVVALVQLVPTSELGAHGIPQQLEQLHTIDRGDAVVAGPR